jgi:hypothetical protein
VSDVYGNIILEDIKGMLNDKNETIRNHTRTLFGWLLNDTDIREIVDGNKAVELIVNWIGSGNADTLKDSISRFHLTKDQIPQGLIEQIIGKLKNKHTCDMASRILMDLDECIDDDEIRMIAGILKRKNEYIRSNVLPVLHNKIHRSEYAWNSVVNVLYGGNVYNQFEAIYVLSEYVNKLDSKVIDKICEVFAQALTEENKCILCPVGDILAGPLSGNRKKILSGKVRDTIVNILTQKMESNNKESRCYAVKALRSLDIEIDLNTRQYAEIISDPDADICCSAMDTLRLSKTIPNETILNTIMLQIKNKDSYVQRKAINMLWGYIDILNEAMISNLIKEKITCYELLKDLYRRGKLENHGNKDLHKSDEQMDQGSL